MGRYQNLELQKQSKRHSLYSNSAYHAVSTHLSRFDNSNANIIAPDSTPYENVPRKLTHMGEFERLYEFDSPNDRGSSLATLWRNISPSKRLEQAEEHRSWPLHTKSVDSDGKWRAFTSDIKQSKTGRGLYLSSIDCHLLILRSVKETRVGACASVYLKLVGPTIGKTREPAILRAWSM